MECNTILAVKKTYCIFLSNFMDLLLETLQQELQKTEDPVEKIRYMIRHHVAAYVAHMCSAKALLKEAYNLSAPKLSKIKSKEKQYFSIIAGGLSFYVGHRLDKDKLCYI